MRVERHEWAERAVFEDRAMRASSVLGELESKAEKVWPAHA